jgi:hypothetical protein
LDRSDLNRLKAASDTNKQVLARFAQETEQFIERAKAETFLTPVEVNFLTFQHWSRWVVNQLDSLEGTVGDLVFDHTRECFDEFVSTFAKQCPPAA